MAAQAQSYVDAGAPPQMYCWSEYFQRRRDDQGELVPVPLLAQFVREPQERLQSLLQQGPEVSFPVAQLMSAMISDTFVESLPSIEEPTQRAQILRQFREDLCNLLPKTTGLFNCEELITAWLKETTSLLRGDIGTLSLVFGGGLVVWLHNTGTDMQFRGLDIGSGVQGLAVRENASVYVPDVMSEDYATFYFQIGNITRSELAVPLSFETHILGVLGWESVRIGDFTHEDRTYAEMLAMPLSAVLSEFGGFREAWQSMPRDQRAFLIPSLLYTLRSDEAPSYRPMPAIPRRRVRRKRRKVAEE